MATESETKTAAEITPLSPQSNIPKISEEKYSDEDDFRKTETRVAFVASIDRALKNMGTCIDRMKGNLRETDDAIELVEIRLSHLKDYETKAKRDREKEEHKITSNGSSNFVE